MYRASSPEPLSSVFDSGLPYGSDDTVRVSNVVAGRHVELVLRHIGTLVVLRKYGRHFSVAVRTPSKVAASFSGDVDIQLCTTACPVAERLSLNHISPLTSIDIDSAADACRKHGLVDFFLDACVFDLLATGGDRNFSLAAVHALRDYRRLSRDAARQLHNRTAIHDTTNVTSRAAAHDLTTILYLTILLLSPLNNLMRILYSHKHFSSAYAV